MQRLDSNTFIFSLLILCVMIILPVEVSACVETKAGAFLILHYGMWCLGICSAKPESGCGVLLHPLQYSLEAGVGFGGQIKEKGK